MPLHFSRNLYLSLAVLFTLFAALFGLLYPMSSQASQPVDTAHPEYAPDRLIVKLRPTAHGASGAIGRSTAVEQLAAASGVLSAKPLFPTDQAKNLQIMEALREIYLLHLQPGRDPQQEAKRLAAGPEVEWAEPDYIARAASLPAPSARRSLSLVTLPPSDPFLPQQWGLAQVSAPDAWETVTGTQTVVVAVLDSGMDLTHPDLQDNLWTNPGEVAGNSLDDDSNGLVDDIHGWNFVDENNDISDMNGHGTEVAGVLGAKGNNALGISGVCWNCRVMPVKVMQNSGFANYSDITQGVLYAARKGARVINLSLGGYASSNALHSAIQEAVNTYGVVVVGGAGNDNNSAAFYPAAYSEVLAVAGTDPSDAKVVSSNYGSWVDLSAPGQAITTTLLGGDYGSVNGTSYAAPFVSGATALLRALHPEWNPAAVYGQLTHTPDDMSGANPGYPSQLGAGRLDIAQAVNTQPHPILSISGQAVDDDPLGKPSPGATAALQLTLTNVWQDASDVQGTLSTTDPQVTLNSGSASFGDITSGASATNTPVFTFTVQNAAGYSHPIAFTLHLSADGEAYTSDLAFSLITRSANENVQGTIGEDITWTRDKTYVVTDNVGVAPGVTLTIQSGTVIKFNGDYSLNVGGTLVADGIENQPIRFMSSTTSGSWGRIFFDDTSLDAQADISGTYQGGSLLRWVSIEGAAQGIGCTNATPFLSHVTMTGGGVTCALGDTPLWFTDSEISGGVSVTGLSVAFWTSHIEQMSIHGGLSLPAASRVSNSQVDGAVTAGDSSHVEQTITTGSISLSSGSVLTSSVKGSVSLNSGLVQANTVTGGGISLGSGQALSNTMTGGGLSLGDGSYARFNNIQDCPGTGITTSGSVTLVKNRVVDCAQGISLSGGVLQESLVANHGSSGLEINGDATVISNTFTGNAGSAVRLLGGTTFTLRNNNLEENKGTYDLENRIIKTTLPILIASQNWWGTTASSVIDQRIFDYNDDYTLSRVTFAPVLSGPETGAPAYVRSVTIDPSPAGIETVHFDVQFSREMDTAQIPALDTLWNRSDVWIAKASMPTARSGLAAVVLNSKIYAIGGLHGNTYIGSVEDYDPSSNTWKMHNTPIYAPGDTAAAVLNGKIYTIGGSIYTSWVVEYDPESDTIRAHSIMPIPRRDCAAVALNGKIYFISCHQQSLNSSSVEEYDPATDTWTTKASLLTARYKPAAAALDGKIFVIGGLDPSGNGLSTVEVYDPASDIWTERTSLPTSRNKLAAVALDGKIYVVGGVDSNWNYLSTLEVFDPASDTWTERASMPSARYGLAATVFDGKVYTFGGFGTGGDLSTVAAYQPAIQYPLENPSWSSSTTSQATLQVTSLTLRGGYTVTVQGAYGSDGLLIAPNSSSTFTVDYASAIADVTPPIIPIVAACSGTESGTLSASWSASDPETQITLYRYAIGAAPGGSEIVNWTTTASVSFARSDLGLIKGQAYYVSVQARNDGGLWSEVAPSNGVIAGSGGCPQASWSAAPTSGYAPLAVAFSSEVTGAIQTRAWSFGDGGSSALDAPVYTYTLPGTYTVTLDVRGPSGRMISSQSEYIHVALDNQPPVGTVTLPGEASMVSGTQVTLQLSVTDPQSGVSEMRFSNDAGNTNALTAWSAWEPFTSTKVWTLSTGDGQKTVYIQFKDRTGNVSSNFEVVVLLDTTAPDGSVQINGGAAAAGSPAVILTLAATDSGSGQIQMHFSNDNRSWSAWEAFTATKNWTLSAGEGAKTVYVQFRDALGNLATYNAQITLDNTGPTGSIAINSGAAATSSPTVTLALSASDPSGLDGMRFSNDSSSWSAWEAFAASKAWTVSTGDGTKTIYVQFRDSLGNINTLSAEISLIDLTSGLYLPLIQG